VPTELWKRRDTDHELPATDRVMMDIVPATAKMTALEKRVMFTLTRGSNKTRIKMIRNGKGVYHKL
jgi:hypothetical protein